MPATDNRSRWPWVAKIIDELRRDFGPDVKVAHISENGRTVAGAPVPPEPYYVPTPRALASWAAFVQSFERVHGPMPKSAAKFPAWCEAHYTEHCHTFRD